MFFYLVSNLHTLQDFKINHTLEDIIKIIVQEEAMHHFRRSPSSDFIGK